MSSIFSFHIKIQFCPVVLNVCWKNITSSPIYSWNDNNNFIIDRIDSVQEHCFHGPHWSNFMNNLIDFQYVAKEQKKSIKSSHVSKETSWGWAGPSSAKLEIGLCWSWDWAWQQSLHIVDMRSTHLANYLCFTKFSLIWVGGAHKD